MKLTPGVRRPWLEVWGLTTVGWYAVAFGKVEGPQPLQVTATCEGDPQVWCGDSIALWSVAGPDQMQGVVAQLLERSRYVEDRGEGKIDEGPIRT